MLEQIESEITQIKDRIAEYQQKISHIYAQYRSAIAGSVSRQLIQATFMSCTRKYPQSFLALTIPQRQELQQGLQKIARVAQTQVSEQLAGLPDQELLNSAPLDELLEKVLSEVNLKINSMLQELNIFPPKTNDSQKIQLRPAEVEYIDRQVMSHRSEMRVLSARCQNLYRELDKKYHIKQVTEAELSWRSIWSEI